MHGSMNDNFVHSDEWTQVEGQDDPIHEGSKGQRMYLRPQTCWIVLHRPYFEVAVKRKRWKQDQGKTCSDTMQKIMIQWNNFSVIQTVYKYKSILVK